MTAALCSWSGDDGCSVASDRPFLRLDDVGTRAVGQRDNFARSSHVADPDWVAWLEWRKLSRSMSLVELDALLFFVGSLLCFDGAVVKGSGLQRVGKNGNSGFELSPHDSKFASGKAILEGGGSVHEEGKVWILVFLEQLLDGLDCPFCFAAVGLRVFG